MILNLLLWILSGFGLVAIVACGYDLAVGFNRWQRRIHIGRWNDVSAWESALENRGRRWFKRMPIVPKLDNDRLIVLDKIRGQYSNPTIQSWQCAGLVLGLSSTGNDGFRTHFIDDAGNWRHIPVNIDFALLAYSLMSESDSHSLDAAMKQIYELILSVKGDNSAVPYRRGMNEVRFVDTIGFICPFLVRYGVDYAVPEAMELARRQIDEYDDMLLAGEVNFPPHAIDCTRRLPLGVYDWGRGIGWYILGVTESYRCLPESDFKEYLKNRIIKLAGQLLQFQKSSGGWGSSVFISDSPAEGSVTSLAGLLMVEAYKITGNKTYLCAAEGAIKQLMAITQRNGALDMCQGDTKGIGNYSVRYGYMPFAQGMALLLVKRFKDAHA